MQENQVNQEQQKKESIEKPQEYRPKYVDRMKKRCYHCFHNMAYRNPNIKRPSDVFWICENCERPIK